MGILIIAALCAAGWSCTHPETAATVSAASVDEDRSPPPSEQDRRMEWWREARFGLFIHWGLYAIPAGEWRESTNHAEWIMHTARIPVDEYETFLARFNPVRFDADSWARMAKDAGMKYIVITSKHHDGFCLFDSAHTDYDVMSTPFKRDIMKELAAACARHGLRMCWYHSIMDWHHHDYLPRRPWEKRSAEGADFDRYVAHMKKQLSELAGNYGEIGVLWFDGEWEGTWNHDHGKDLYEYVRGLQPNIIINNRVDKGRGGMAGLTQEGKYCGDFGTPEQQIPATGLPGVDWETCMTMNNHWGYNKNDHNWKSTADLIRKLVDIASKGGNFLLNVGPTAEGLFPGPSMERLAAIGAWMKANGASIHGTTASPFESLPWGRCTVKAAEEGKTILYLHVFDWPADGRLVVPALDNETERAHLLAQPASAPLPVTREGNDVVIDLPAAAPDQHDSVVALTIRGRPVVIKPPSIATRSARFIDERIVELATDVAGSEIRYTLDGREPTARAALCEGPIVLTETCTLKAAVFRDRKRLSRVEERGFTKVVPQPAIDAVAVAAGLDYAYYEGEWRALPDFAGLEAVRTGRCETFTIDLERRDEKWAFTFEGFVKVARDGLYTFYTDSDDGSRLLINGAVVVDNDGLHSPLEKAGEVALEAGFHAIEVSVFELSGGELLDVSVAGPGVEKQSIPAGMLFRSTRTE